LNPSSKPLTSSNPTAAGAAPRACPALLALTLAFLSLHGLPARAADLDSDAVRAPFASADLDSALDHLRSHRARRASGLEPVRADLLVARGETEPVSFDFLAHPVPLGLASPDLVAARTALEAALAKGLGDELDEAVVVAQQLLAESGDSTASAAAAAVAAMLHPGLADSLRLDAAVELRRAGAYTPELLPGGDLYIVYAPKPSSAADNAPERLSGAALSSGRPPGAQQREATALIVEQLFVTYRHAEAAEVLASALLGPTRSADAELLCPFFSPLAARLVHAPQALAPLSRAALVACPVVGTRLDPELTLRLARLVGRFSTFVPLGDTYVFSASEHVASARVLYAAVQHDAVLARLKGVLDAPQAELEPRCEALWLTAMTYRRSRRASQSQTPYERMLSECESLPEWHMRGLYGVAWNQLLDGEDSGARLNLQALIDRYPESRYTDDALLGLVQIANRADDSAAALAAADEVIKLGVTGDLSGEALWLALADRGEPQRLERAVQASWDDPSLYSAGRLAYHQAKLQEKDGTDVSAKYEAIVEAFPLSFYAYLSWTELAKTEAGQQAWKERLAAGRELGESLLFSGLPDSPEMDRAREWIGVGRCERAADELERAFGLENGPVSWVIALCWHLEGRPARSHDLPRRVILGWDKKSPKKQNRLLWELAYPRPYLELVTATAEKTGVDSALLYAVMREESAFEPKVESYAQAIGLLQLLESTGASEAKSTYGWTIDRADLQNPAINIPVGAAFLAHIAAKTSAHPTLMAAAYNAGRGALAGWLKKRKREALYRFVEHIPYDQTRNYSKRVTNSLLVYRVLYGDGEVEMLDAVGLDETRK